MEWRHITPIKEPKLHYQNKCIFCKETFTSKKRINTEFDNSICPECRKELRNK